MSALSPKRQQILDFITRFIQEKDYPPAVRDVADGCGISSSSVAQYHLQVLEKEGYIRRDREVARGISLASSPPGPTTVPLLGSIAAGKPIPVPTPDVWLNPAQERLELPAALTSNRDALYALRVKGNFLIDALIDDGDIVLMQQTSSADDGDMVAVWWKDRAEVTLKKIYREAGRTRLMPVNPLLAPIYCRPENVTIQGRVVGVLRKL